MTILGKRLEDFARQAGQPVHRVVVEPVCAWLDMHSGNKTGETP